MQDRSKKEVETIRYMVEERLKTRSLLASEMAVDSHLDDDTISAFVEARLSEVEATPVIAHLVVCGSCRRTTAQLVRLESDEDDEPEQVMTDESPGPLRLLFEDLTAGLARPAAEDVVFAYQNPESNADDQDANPPAPAPDEEEPEG
jgi:hypothetical protein